MQIHDMVETMAKDLSAEELHAFAVEFYNARMGRISPATRIQGRITNTALPIKEEDFKAAWTSLWDRLNEEDS